MICLKSLVIWSELVERNGFPTVTNFTEYELLSLVHDTEQFREQFTTRGPKPKLTLTESILTLISYYKNGGAQDVMATWWHIKPSTFSDSLERTRKVLYATLKHKWWENKMRPKIAADQNYPEITLIGDSTSREVFHPKAPFNEAKQYYDNKNHIYALKKEIAVTRAAPHYCLFTQPAVPGSVHDYSYFKQNYLSYCPYLLKTPEERATLSSDRQESRWAILLDSGYIGPDNDHPELRKITLRKPTTIEVMK